MSKKPTLELPPHVQRVVSGGREYFYFQKGRSTKSPGPRHKLPGTPHSPEFWEACRSFLGCEQETGSTFDNLIAAYKLAPEFTRRAEATKRDYVRYLDIISEAWGKLLVANLRPKHVLQLRDAWADTPSAANHLLSVLKTLINWGIPREFSDTNACANVQKLETEEHGARPWPAWAYELIEEHAPEDIKRAVLLARSTGQRQADVLRMGHQDLEDGGLNVRQQKTGKQLWVPLHSDLVAAIADWHESPFVQKSRGGGYTPDQFRAAWTRLMNETPAGRIRAEGYTFHGLRASSVEKLREAGCGDREIEAITGMSVQMITRYSRFADQKSLARKGFGRLERSPNTAPERARN